MLRALTRIRLALVAIGGVFAGHTVAYAVAGMATHVHGDESHQLHDAMHGYMPTASRIVFPVAAVALLSLLVDVIRRHSGLSNLGSLARLQIGLFVALETAEHVATGVAAESLLDAPALWLGIAAQLVVSGTLVVFAVLTTRVAAAMRPALTPIGITAAEQSRRVPVITVGTISALGTAISRRGPPVATHT